jgi:hypothetical protein
MAESRNLSIIINAKNNATKELDSLRGKVEELKPTFQRMAAIGTAAFTTISVGIYKSIQAAAENEGAWNKFNTVFGEHAGDMSDFITDIRKRLPSATTDVIKMSSGLQDLFIPMGFAREEAMGLTQETLELANALAAFNDVQVDNVIEAMISGFTGMTRPLKQFGVDIPLERLQQMAIEQGIVKKSLDELSFEERRTTKAQLTLQAAYEDSSDALEGFGANQDSFIRRQQELKASIADTVNAIGDAFLPIMDGLLKKILPVIESFKNWTEENPELTKKITFLALAVSGLLVFVGLLGLALPIIITGFSFLISPIGLLIGVVIILVALFRDKLLDIFRKTEKTLSGFFDMINEKTGVVDFLKRNWELLILMFKERLMPTIKELWEKLTPLKLFIEVLAKVVGIILYGAFLVAATIITTIVIVAIETLSQAIEIATGIVDWFKKGWENLVDYLGTVIYWIDEVVKKVKKLNVLDAFKNLPANLGFRERRANGGAVRGGTTYMVGEQGPELFTPSIGGNIIPNHKLRGASGGQVVNITVNGDVSGNDLIEKVKRGIMGELTLNTRNAY